MLKNSLKKQLLGYFGTTKYGFLCVCIWDVWEESCNSNNKKSSRLEKREREREAGETKNVDENFNC